MFLGPFIAGNIPLSVSLNPQRLNLINTFSAGVMVGTALIVIIPEGIETLYESRHKKLAVPQNVSSKHSHRPRPVIDAENSNDSLTIGLALTIGFVFMLLVDNSFASFHDPGHQFDLLEAAETILEKQSTKKGSEKSMSAIIGLLVHSAADGLAFGAASIGEQSKISLVVFIAIMAHKAPSAFALSAFLLKQGQVRRNIRSILGAFSLAAPITSTVTIATLHYWHALDTLSMSFYTSIILLFSGGTFLFVSAMHILPEVYDHGHGRGPLSHSQVAILILGIFSPLLLSAGVIRFNLASSLESH